MRDWVTVGQKTAAVGRARDWSLKPRSVPRFGLATRVLVLVVAFVMVTEACVYIPIVSNYRDNWLRNRLSAAYTATLVLEAAPRAMVPEALSRQLLENVGVRIIVLKAHGTRRILAAADLPHEVDEFYDLRHSTFLQALASTFRASTAAADRVITVVGDAPTMGDAI